MYFPDHSAYCFGLEPVAWPAEGPASSGDPYVWLWDFPTPEPAFAQEEINIGWLDLEHEFPRGTADASFALILEQACRTSRYHLWRGYSMCSICGAPIDQQGAGAEIRIQGTGCVYASPTALAHYVQAHEYLPPGDFVESVLVSQGRPPEPIAGTRRKIPPHLLARHDISPEALAHAVLRMIKLHRREGEIREVKVERASGDFIVSAVLVPGEPHEPIPRIWQIANTYVLNEEQGASSIESMLANALEQKQRELFRIQKRRERSGKSP